MRTVLIQACFEAKSWDLALLASVTERKAMSGCFPGSYWVIVVRWGRVEGGQELGQVRVSKRPKW